MNEKNIRFDKDYIIKKPPAKSSVRTVNAICQREDGAWVMCSELDNTNAQTYCQTNTGKWVACSEADSIAGKIIKEGTQSNITIWLLIGVIIFILFKEK